MSKELIDNHYRFREIELISNRMKTDSFTLANEYYIVNKHRGRQVVKITDKGINNCEVGFDAQNKEMYIAMFTAKTAWSQWMITAVYNKLDYGWKLNELEMNPYTINGKTAPELYNEAKESYKKGYIVDAVNTMAMVADCAHPNDGWEYNSLKDLNSFYTGLVDEANVKYKFPLTLSAVGTKPRIFRIFNQAMPDGTFPMVYYISRINVKDTVAIRKENNAIKSTIDKTIPGLANNKKYVLYSAFNELPNSRRESDHYNMR
jgi:hypothetical protein